jgi:esterase
MGGMAMQRVLLMAPERIERMVGITAVPASGSGMPDARLAMFESAIDDLQVRESILDASTGNRLPKPWLTHMARQSFATSLPKAFGAYLQDWARTDFSELVRGNPTPVKLIVGANDPSLTAERMERTWMTCYRNSTLETLPNAGHYPMHEVPLALAATIQSFLLQS